MVSKGEEDNMAIIKEFMRFKVHMEGSVNGHEFEIEGEGEGRPYEGTQTAKLKVTKGGPLPFAWDILSPQFMYGSKAYVKHPADIPDYLKLSFPEGFKWERVMNFEDGGVVTVTQDSSLQDGEFIYKVKLRGTNFPSDGPVMQKKTMGWEASSERMYPEDGALKGEIKQRLKLKDGGHYDAEVKTTYKAKKPVQLPGAYNVNIKLDITSHNEDYTIVEQYERAEGRHSTGGMDELYKGYPSHWRPLEMAQARVTDYFAQSKKAGVSRSLRSKGQKVSGDVVESAVINKPRSSSRASGSSRKATHSEITTAEPQKQTQLEFLKVIDEALSTETADTVADSRDVKIEGLTASPRTPKRSSPEFDVCSVLFPSTAELHSSAKKRQRLNAGHNCRSSPEERAGQKTARKKLYLLASDDKVKTTEPLASSSPQAPQQTARKE
nr:zFucci-G1 phase probe [synthetic construct]